MFQDYKTWTWVDDYHIEKVEKYRNYIKVMYYKLKKIYKDDLDSDEWSCIVEELKRQDSIIKAQKLKSKKEKIITEIAQPSFFDEYSYLYSLPLKELKKRQKRQRPKKVTQKYKHLTYTEVVKRSNAYQHSVLLVDYLRATTLELVCKVKPKKLLDSSYILRSINLSGKEVVLTVKEMIEKEPPFVREKLQEVYDYCVQILDTVE